MFLTIEIDKDIEFNFIWGKHIKGVSFGFIGIHLVTVKLKKIFLEASVGTMHINKEG